MSGEAILTRNFARSTRTRWRLSRDGGYSLGQGAGDEPTGVLDEVSARISAGSGAVFPTAPSGRSSGENHPGLSIW